LRHWFNRVGLAGRATSGLSDKPTFSETRHTRKGLSQLRQEPVTSRLGMAMLPECQSLVLVPELTPETRGMIGAKELAALPRGTIVVNTGRGQVLDLDALNDALEDASFPRHKRLAQSGERFPKHYDFESAALAITAISAAWDK
jgi:hypothetical protein